MALLKPITKSTIQSTKSVIYIIFQINHKSRFTQVKDDHKQTI